MKVTQCDRCNAIFDHKKLPKVTNNNYHTKQFQNIEVVSNDGDTIRYIDLCEDCFKEFRTWLNKCQKVL